MPDETEANGNDLEDRSDETLTPKEAYSLTEEQGLMGKTVAKIYDISPARVSQLKGHYKEAREEGREAVGPEDFEEEELREALGDEPPDHNPYEGTDCPRCGEEILEAEKPDSAGTHDCPHCSMPIEWEENEL